MSEPHAVFPPGYLNYGNFDHEQHVEKKCRICKKDFITDARTQVACKDCIRENKLRGQKRWRARQRLNRRKAA